MIRKIHLVAAVTAAVLCAACDTHIDVPDTAVRPGHILCEDGTALPYAQYEQTGKKAIAVVFRYRKTRRYGGGWLCSLPVGHCSTGIRRQPRHCLLYTSLLGVKGAQAGLQVGCEIPWLNHGTASKTVRCV